MLNNFLITGLPGTGKTTLIMRLADNLHDRKIAGFYTQEIRKGGQRQGFELVDFEGRRQVLSHISIKSPHRVGKYGVDVDGFERYLGRTDLNRSNADVIIIDEIGKMECLSRKFVQLVSGLLARDTVLVATIAMKGGGVIAEIRRRPDVRIVELTPANRDHIVPRLIAMTGLK